MANSTRARIQADIKTTLAAIATGGGYNYTPGYVKRGLRHHNQIPEDAYPALFVAGADEKRINVTNTTFRSDLLVSVVGFVRAPSGSDETDVEALETALDNLIEDVTKALYVDITRGGYAVLTEIGDVDTDKGALAPVAGFEMIVRCQYRAAVATP